MIGWRSPARKRRDVRRLVVPALPRGATSDDALLAVLDDADVRGRRGHRDRLRFHASGRSGIDQAEGYACEDDNNDELEREVIFHDAKCGFVRMTPLSAGWHRMGCP